MKTMNAFKYDVSPDGNITVWRLSWYSQGGIDPLSKKTITGRMVTLFINNRCSLSRRCSMMIATCYLDNNMLIASENHVTLEVARQCWSDLTTYMNADQIPYADMLRLSLSYSLLPRKI